MRYKALAFAASLLPSIAQGQDLRFVDSHEVINAPNAANPLDNQLVASSRTFIETLVPSDRGPYEQYIRLGDLTMVINRRADEGIALAASFNVLPPNPDDRFAVSFGGAGISGKGAGSASASMRIKDNAMAYVGYAHGAHRGMVKGGVGFSFK